MSDIIMPLKFTCMLADGWDEGFLPNYVEGKPDVGAPIRRAISTKVSEYYNWISTLDMAGNEEFKAFYKTTLVGGIRPFIYTHIFTGEEILCFFEGFPSSKYVAPRFHRGMQVREV